MIADHYFTFAARQIFHIIKVQIQIHPQGSELSFLCRSTHGRKRMPLLLLPKSQPLRWVVILFFGGINWNDSASLLRRWFLCASMNTSLL